jgi:hypothetical protein
LSIHDRNDLFNPGELPGKFGWWLLDDGTALIANRTFFPNVDGEMFDWWFGWQIIDGKPVKCIPDGFKIPSVGPICLLNHNVKEFSNLARILPDVYREEKDNWY